MRENPTTALLIKQEANKRGLTLDSVLVPSTEKEVAAKKSMICWCKSRRGMTYSGIKQHLNATDREICEALR